MITLSEEQTKVLNGLVTWLKNNREKPNPAPAILAGSAGTGKTTLVVKFIETLEKMEIKNVAVVTCTGKASDVVASKMRGAGLTSCYVGTIHSLIYRVKDMPLSSGSSSDTENKVEFVRLPNSAISRGENWDLIIVDELSMLDSEKVEDLLKYKAPILFCGDDQQLTPINGVTAELLKEPTFVLDEVHRQAADNPIIKVATMVRKGEAIPYGVLSKKFIRIANSPAQTLPLVNGFIQKYFVNKDGTGVILCAENRVRHMFNSRVREKLGHADKKFPQEGEIVVCLKNDKNTGLKNGTLCLVSKPCVIDPDGDEGMLTIVNLSSMVEAKVCCHLPTFAGNLDFRIAQSRPELMFFNYGYALTVHKAQGSEWDAVMLYNKKMPKQDEEEYRRWLYTGVTRASQKLIMVG